MDMNNSNTRHIDDIRITNHFKVLSIYLKYYFCQYNKNTQCYNAGRIKYRAQHVNFMAST